MLFDQFDVQKWDCKSIGTPWNAEEVFAVRNEGIPAEAVRQGILTREDYEASVGNTPKVVKEVVAEDFPLDDPANLAGTAEEQLAVLVAKIQAIDPEFIPSPKATVNSLTKKLDAITPIEEVVAE